MRCRGGVRKIVKEERVVNRANYQLVAFIYSGTFPSSHLYQVTTNVCVIHIQTLRADLLDAV